MQDCRCSCMQGSILTFFAFIGFEDTINVAEEVKNPRRTIPIALVSAMLIAAVLYMAVAITAVSVVPYKELAAAPAPLAEVMKRAAPDFPAVIMTFITLFAVANTALVNYITSSRLVYGMAHQGLLPAEVGEVHPTRQTPHVAIGLLLLILAPLALVGEIKDLASATVLLLLTVFCIVNGALYILKRRPGEAKGVSNSRLGCRCSARSRARCWCCSGSEAAIGKHPQLRACCWRGSWLCTLC